MVLALQGCSLGVLHEPLLVSPNPACCIWSLKKTCLKLSHLNVPVVPSRILTGVPTLPSHPCLTTFRASKPSVLSPHSQVSSLMICMAQSLSSF